MSEKGFAGVLFVLAVFIVTIMLLGVNNTTLNQPSHKEMITESKLVINNYELNLLQMTKDCNWEKSEAELRNCVDQNSTTLLNKINLTLSSTICTRNNFTSSGKNFTIDLNCITKAEGKKVYLTINASKIIKIGTSWAHELSAGDALFNANLVGLWHLNNDLSDSSGKNITGTCTSCPTKSTGLWDTNARTFSGSTKVNLDGLGVNTADYAKNTVAFWMKWDGTNLPNGLMPFGWTDYDLFIYNNCFGFNTFQANVLGVSSVGLENKWVHVVAIFYNGVSSSTQNELYINGIKQTISDCVPPTSPVVTRSATTSASISDCRGTQCGTYPFSGQIEELSIWNRALTSTEIAGLYNSQNISSTSFMRKELSTSDALFDANLVGLWHLNNEGTDSSGKGNNASAMLVPAAADRFGNLNSAYYFNGTTSFIKMNASQSLNLKNKLTMTAWIKPAGTLQQPILEYNNGTAYGVHLWQFNPYNSLFTNLNDTSRTYHSLTATGQITIGSWQQVGVTYDGKNYKLYKNGNLLVTSATEIFIPQTSYDFYIGKRPSTCNPGEACNFTGSLDEVAIWDRNLSAAEMLALYNSQKVS